MVPKLKIKLLFIILISLISIKNTNGQLNFSLGTSQRYSNNPFSSPVPTATWISSIGFGVSKEIESFGLGYNGSYNLFLQAETRDYYWHQLGFWYSAENSRFGLSFEQRLNTIEYEYYNYTDLNANYKLRFQLEDINIFTNTSLSLTDYPYLNDLDNVLGNIGFMLNTSFETKTTLIGGLDYNYKNYFSTNLNSTDLTGDSLVASSSKAYTSQFNFYGRVAQSLTESTGLAIQYSNKNIIGGTANFVRELDYVYGDESQYFDDPISYEGYTISAQLTQLLPKEIILRSIFSYTTKKYPSQGIYTDYETYDQNTIRNDELTEFNISLSKYFYLGSELQNTIMLSLSYEFRNSNSNSYWYNFESNQILLNFNYLF